TIVNGDVYTETFSASNAGLIDIAIGESFPQGMDIDLYLYRWNGATYSLVASSAGSTAFEEVRLTMPQSGDYLILVDGYSVPAGTGKFDMGKLIIQGTRLTPANVPGSSIPSGANAHFNVTWNFAGTLPGFYIGIMFVGPKGAPAVEVDALFALFDANPPVILSTSPDYALTRIAPTNVSGTTEVGATVTVNGATTGVNPTTGAFSRTILLGEGPNTITVVARDVAGNTAQVTRSVNLDTTPPILTLTVPAAGSRVLTNVVHVAGTTEADATVTVDGISASMASGGDFSVDIVLPDGRYTITAV